MAENDLRIQSHIDGQEAPGAEQPPGQPMDGGQEQATDIEDGGPANVDAPDTRRVWGDEVDVPNDVSHQREAQPGGEDGDQFVVSKVVARRGLKRPAERVASAGGGGT